MMDMDSWPHPEMADGQEYIGVARGNRFQFDKRV